MIYTVKDIAAIIATPAMLAQPDAIVEHLVTDSRKIAFPDKTVFFALQTARRDAHFFIKELYERGVRNFIVRKDFATGDLPAANFIFADDTLHALQKLAAHHRAQFNYPVIGITGSNGKTIVKEWLYQLLSPDYNIVRSPRSYNSQTGVPLSIWQMSASHDLAIIEAGISKPGEMQALETIIHPDIGVLTTIGSAHDANFESMDQKATEKIKLFQHAQTLICNADDPVIEKAVSQLNQVTLFSWGRSAKALVKTIAINKQAVSTTIEVLWHGSHIAFTIPFVDDASVQNAITCLCTMLYLKTPVEKIQQRMLQLQPVDMRLQLMHGINQCVLINDSYSFDINSFSIALDFLIQQLQHVQKTVIVSDIPSADTVIYRQVVDMLQARNIYRVITIGAVWHEYQHLLINKIAVTEHFLSTQVFIQHFSTAHFRNEAILLKGARIFGFEKIVSLLETKVHQTVMEINLTAVVHNLNQYRSRLQKGVKLMAMVKAFAYGSGSAEIAGLLQFHKVDYLAVAYADEGVELRKAGINLPVMVMNADEAAFETLVQHNLEPELFSFTIFRSFNHFLEKQGLQQYPVHIKLDTGMHRLGFEEKDLPSLIRLLQGNRQLTLKSVFSHLAASEDPAEDLFTKQQAHVFETCCAQIRAVLKHDFIMHISNSAAILRLPFLQYDMVRLGIGLYGIDSSNGHALALQTAVTLKTTIAQLRTVKAGDTVGYNRRGKITADSVIATIRIGYADGFSRRLSNGVGKVLIHGREAPVIGTVAMDMTMIDVTGIPGIKEGDEVEIFGIHIPVQDVAKACDTISYEILTGVNQRVKRVYVEE